MIVWLGDGAALNEVIARIERVLGIAFYAVARPVERGMDALCQAAWQEIEPLQSSSFAVRAKRSDKTFPQSSLEAESQIGKYLLGNLARVDQRNMPHDFDVAGYLRVLQPHAYGTILGAQAFDLHIGNREHPAEGRASLTSWYHCRLHT